MSSSKNQFAPLGENSSSNEKEIPVSATDTTVQTTRDVSQAGSSAEGPSSAIRDLLKAGLPKDHAGRVEFVRKVRENFEAMQLQESNVSKEATKPLPSTSPSQLLGKRKRSASADEAEEPRKRQRKRKGSDSRSQTAQEVPIIASMTESDNETEKSNDGGEHTSAMVVQEDPYLSPPNSFDWRDLRMPKYPLLCVVQVNHSIRIGSFDKDTTNWAFQLTFHAEQKVVPNMTMKFFSNGIKEPQSAQTGWCLGEWMESDWMVTDFKVHRVADCAESSRIRHHHVLGLCKTEEEKARLICISLEAWPKILGHFNRDNRWKNPQPGVKKLFSAVLTGRRPYHLRIWFLAPGNLEDFERRCLSIFTLWFQQRKPHYDGIRDVNGISFNPSRP